MHFAHSIALLLMLGVISVAQDTNFVVGPQYLITTHETTFLHPIATPSMSLDAPLSPIPNLPQIGPQITAPAYISSPELQHQPDLFPIYYGYPRIAEIELIASESREVRAGINDTGYAAIADAQSLRQLGYGLTVSEAASFWKSHKRSASRVYTNADIRR